MRDMMMLHRTPEGNTWVWCSIPAELRLYPPQLDRPPLKVWDLKDKDNHLEKVYSKSMKLALSYRKRMR